MRFLEARVTEAMKAFGFSATDPNIGLRKKIMTLKAQCRSVDANERNGVLGFGMQLDKGTKILPSYPRFKIDTSVHSLVHGGI